jgi:hypothetical protein
MLATIIALKLALVLTLFVGRGVEAVTADRHAIWVVVPDSGTLRRIPPSGAAKRIRSVKVMQGASDVVAGDDGAWAIAPSRGQAQHVDPSGTRVLASVDIPTCGSGAAALDGDGRVYYLCSDTGTVTTITGSHAGPPRRVASPRATSITYADGSVWIADVDRNAVQRMPTSSREPR